MCAGDRMIAAETRAEEVELAIDYGIPRRTLLSNKKSNVKWKKTNVNCQKNKCQTKKSNVKWKKTNVNCQKTNVKRGNMSVNYQKTNVNYKNLISVKMRKNACQFCKNQCQFKQILMSRPVPNHTRAFEIEGKSYRKNECQ